MKAIIGFVKYTVWTALAAFAVMALLYHGWTTSREVGLVEGKSDAVVMCFEHADTTAEVEACSALYQGLGFEK